MSIFDNVGKEMSILTITLKVRDQELSFKYKVSGGQVLEERLN